jgi:transposase-like protein
VPAAMLVVDGHRPVREVTRELDVNHETLRNWVAALRRERAWRRLDTGQVSNARDPW